MPPLRGGVIANRSVREWVEGLERGDVFFEGLESRLEANHLADVDFQIDESVCAGDGADATHDTATGRRGGEDD